MSQNVQPRPGKKRQSDDFTAIQQKTQEQKCVKASVCIYTEIQDTYAFPQKKTKQDQKQFKGIFHPKMKKTP